MAFEFPIPWISHPFHYFDSARDAESRAGLQRCWAWQGTSWRAELIDPDAAIIATLQSVGRMCTMKCASTTSIRAGILLATMLTALCTLPRPALAQRATLQGIVLSENTGSPLEGVVVTLDTGDQPTRGAITDRNGYYQIGQIPPGRYLLSGRLLGYREYQQQVTLAADERGRANFRLEVEPVRLQGIEVRTAKRAQGAPIRDLGRQVVTPQEISMVPVPAGTGDLATYIQTLPGVSRVRWRWPITMSSPPTSHRRSG